VVELITPVTKSESDTFFVLVALVILAWSPSWHQLSKSTTIVAVACSERRPKLKVLQEAITSAGLLLLAMNIFVWFLQGSHRMDDRRSLQEEQT
jgi:hypothetical protein